MYFLLIYLSLYNIMTLDKEKIREGAVMKKKILLFICLILCFVGVIGCKKQSGPTDNRITEGTIEERLERLDRVQDVKFVTTTDNFEYVFSFNFIQYIDHNNKDAGTFTQKIEMGFNDFDLPNVFVTTGYFMSDNNYEYEYNENEVAFLIKSNYIYVEHRYFGESLPVEIDYYNVHTWDYLTTKQAADDLHDICTEFKRILDGKWVATGISKGGITATLYAYYYPGEMDLYMPYVAPFINSYSDTRWVKYIYEEIGDDFYGKELAKEMRDNVLAFQVKLFEYKEVLSPRFYQDALDEGVLVTEYLNPKYAYDMAVMDLGFAFWQYYQYLYDYLVQVLTMSEDTEEDIQAKQDEFYVWLYGTASINYGTNSAFTPYFIQAYQELGNIGYDFSYIREALGDEDFVSIGKEDEKDILWKCMFDDGKINIEHIGLIAPHIENMLKNTKDKFIIIYGSSDPFYSVKTDDVDNPNVTYFVDKENAHSSYIQTLNAEDMAKALALIKEALGVNE